MLERLREKGVKTLEEALNEILSWNLPLSIKDSDILTALPFETIPFGHGNPVEQPTQETHQGSLISGVQEWTPAGEYSKRSPTIASPGGIPESKAIDEISTGSSTSQPRA